MIVLGSLGHGPGVTTTAVALTLGWHRRVLLVEADTATTSSVLAGRFRGQVHHTVGLTNLSAAAARGDLTADEVLEQSLELGPDRHVLPGFAGLGAARGADAFWQPFTETIAPLEEQSIDVLVDVGRIHAGSRRNVLLTHADLVVVATGATLPDIAALIAPVDPTTTALDEVRAIQRDAEGDGQLALVVIDRARENYAPREIEQVAKAPVIGHLPWSPEAAAVFSLGAPETRKGRDGLTRPIASLARSMQEHLDAGGPPTAEAADPLAAAAEAELREVDRP